MSGQIKTHPFGAFLQYSIDNIVAYATLADIQKFTPPNLKKNDTKITHLLSPNAAHEYMASWIEAGEVPFVGYFSKAQYAALLVIFLKGPGPAGTYFWKINLPLVGAEVINTLFGFQGHMKELALSELSEASDDAVMMPCVIKITGLPTFTPGS